MRSPSDGAAHDAQDGGRGTAAAAADLVAHGPAGNGAHQAAGARLGLLDHHLLVGADLARHGGLLDDRRGGDDAADFLRLGDARGAQADQGQDKCLLHGGPRWLAWMRKV